MCDKYYKFVEKLEQKIKESYIDEAYSNLIFLCIGTNKVVGDSIGPIVGNSLKCMENDFVQIYGTIENTLNFRNAKEIIERLQVDSMNPFFVTIDAALSSRKRVGEIILNKGYIKIGKALEKSICFYSNINIKCIVGRNMERVAENILELKRANQNEIYKMSKIVSSGIENVLKKVEIYV